MPSKALSPSSLLTYRYYVARDEHSRGKLSEMEALVALVALVAPISEPATLSHTASCQRTSKSVQLNIIFELYTDLDGRVVNCVYKFSAISRVAPS